MKSYVRDDIDFLKHIPDTIGENEVLVTFDVPSLYSNISHELGLEAISYWIDKMPHKIDSRFSKEFIM